MPPHKSQLGERALRHMIKTTPIIDHHAHPLLRVEHVKLYPLLTVSTEAHGDAIAAAETSLSHMRAVRQLAAILECDPTWEDVEAEIAQRRALDYDAWIARCLAGVETVLVDDGLANQDEVHPYTFFDHFARSRSKRIVRIEAVAAQIIDRVLAQAHSFNAFVDNVFDQFTTSVRRDMRDPEVVAFKSVICYRTGLAIPENPDMAAARKALRPVFDKKQQDKEHLTFDRLEHPGLNEAFVHRLARLISDMSPEHEKKPIQFHTGLGDNDITLSKSSPALLQDFIKAYPTVPMVLLHASYPYMREAAYLATVYANVYTDIGEVFPQASRDGQEAVIRQVLELCPYSKLLWSTDGHYFPETYLLAVEQVREAMGTVLVDYLLKGDLKFDQALKLVHDVFFNNANKLYNLDLDLVPLDLIPEGELVASTAENVRLLTNFLHGRETPRFLRIYWNDMTAMPRMRAIPMRRIFSMLSDDEELSFGVTKASLGLLQNDVPAPGVTPTGEYKLHPDLSTLRLGPRTSHITVQGDFKEKDGSPVALCPRSLLKRVLGEAAEQGLEFVFGFEIEFLLTRRIDDESRYEALDGDGHAWSVGRAMEHPDAADFLDEAIDHLDAAGVYVDMVHPESANGQYEVVLPKAPALKAVDTLLYARDILNNCATGKGFRMTLHPKPFAAACGTAAHAHMSISTARGSDPAVYEPFYAGVLKHLKAIAAFTYSSMASYERVVDGCWAGGTWVAWGTQNRETPLRKVDGSHWELKCMDGMANPYLAMSAVVLAGVQGVADKEALMSQDCEVDPATLTEEERERLGVREKLPTSVGEALAALEGDQALTKLLGPELVERYVAVKNAETAMLESMGEEERRLWVMERY